MVIANPICEPSSRYIFFQTFLTYRSWTRTTTSDFHICTNPVINLCVSLYLMAFVSVNKQNKIWIHVSTFQQIYIVIANKHWKY